MTCLSISERVEQLSIKVLKGSMAIALLLLAMGTASTPAKAQTSDTWKSVAIIGGSTAAGAYIGHKVAGSTGAYIGAAAGATAGYAIDRKRRQSEYGYNNNGYAGDNSGYYGGPDNAPPPPPYGYRSNFRTSR